MTEQTLHQHFFEANELSPFPAIITGALSKFKLYLR
jgi:hypothetical protein